MTKEDKQDMKKLKKEKEELKEQFPEDSTKKEESVTTIKAEEIAQESPGEIWIAPEVLSMIVNRAVMNTQGVSGLVVHSKGGFGTLLGVKEMEEGIKVEMIDKNQVSAFISVTVEYGSVIIDVAKNIQTDVKKEIENQTGLSVKNIDVSIMGLEVAKKTSKAISGSDVKK